jgi:importin subunit beta-1
MREMTQDVILQSVIRKLNDGIQPLADRIMTLVLQLIQAAGKTSTVLEDAFLVVGSLASGEWSRAELA